MSMGIDAAEGRMELPSILGLAWIGCRNSDEAASIDSDAVSQEHTCVEASVADERLVSVSPTARVHSVPVNNEPGSGAPLDAVMHTLLWMSHISRLAQASLALERFE